MKHRHTHRRIAVAVAATAAGGLFVVVLLAWLAMLAGAQALTTSDDACDAPTIPTAAIPVVAPSATLAQLFTAAAAHYHLGVRGPSILAAIADVETGFGANEGPSSAGAVGFMQFEPATWARYGVDADGDGIKNPSDPADAIYAAANYLHASGAPHDWPAAIFAYNHSAAYVATVLAKATGYAHQLPGTPAPQPTADTTSCNRGSGAVVSAGPVGGVEKITGGGALAAIPGQPGMQVDDRILPDVIYLIGRYHLTVTAAYATTGHAPDGEHPLGLAVDLVPAPDGNWDLVDKLAYWAEPQQNHPIPPFRWVGYNGDPGHGRGNHLHLSWAHAPTNPGQRPVAWVDVFTIPGQENPDG